MSEILCEQCGQPLAAHQCPDGTPPPSAGSAYVVESQRVQWWLGKLDRHDNVRELTDGAHSKAAGAHKAMYLFNRLGLADKDTKYAVVRCEVFEPIPDGSRANQDALKTLNSIGLGQNTEPTGDRRAPL